MKQNQGNTLLLMALLLGVLISPYRTKEI